MQKFVACRIPPKSNRVIAEIVGVQNYVKRLHVQNFLLQVMLLFFVQKLLSHTNSLTLFIIEKHFKIWNAYSIYETSQYHVAMKF